MSDTAFVCPRCGGQLQFTENLFCNIDPDTGEVEVSSAAGAVYDLYCENDCFIAEDLDEEPSGHAAIKIAEVYLGLADGDDPPQLARHGND